MKRFVLAACLLLGITTAFAQQPGQKGGITSGFTTHRPATYFVTTSNIQKSDATEGDGESEEGQASVETEDEELSFFSRYFRFRSLCDWTPGMRFMVMPEKYDMVVKTFTDATQKKMVSSMSLRHKIMVYKGHDEGDNGHPHINFELEEDGHPYYYEIPGTDFDDYCYGKLGVPTLAYLGDVDMADTLLVGKQVFTEAQNYMIDTNNTGEGYQDVFVGKGKVVTITAVGVGTRKYPVKVIVTDSTDNNRQFFQYVAISNTNSGMRDDEFVEDEVMHLFGNSFRLVDETIGLPKDIQNLVGQHIFNFDVVEMESKGDGKDRKLRVPALTGFSIEKIDLIPGTSYSQLTLRETITGRIYNMQVTFNSQTAVDQARGANEGNFQDLFRMGEGKTRTINPNFYEAIKRGRVSLTMTKEEVQLAMGMPDRTGVINGTEFWAYSLTSTVFIAAFDAKEKVNYWGKQSEWNSGGAKPATRRR